MRLVTTALIAALAPAALALSAPARAEVVSSSDDGFVVHAEADVTAERFAVWNALVAPAKWWAPEHTISGIPAGLYLDAQATGCFCELLPVNPSAPEGTRRSSIEHLHVVASIPGSMLRLTGGLGPLQAMPVRGVFTVTLEPKGEGTALAFDYAVAGAGGKGAQLAPVVDKVVGEQLARLAALFGTPKPAAKVAPRDEVSLEKPAVEAPAPEVAPASVADAPAADVTVAGAPVPDVAGAETTAVEASVEKKVAPAKIQPKARSKAKARARPNG